MKRYPSMKKNGEHNLCNWSAGCPMTRVNKERSCDGCELDGASCTKEEAIKKLHEMGYVIDGVVNKPIIEEF